VASGSCSVGFVCAALALCFLRAPWETRWVGWRGGWNMRRRDLGNRPKDGEEAAVEEGVNKVNSDAELDGVVKESGHASPLAAAKILETEGKQNP